MLLSPVWLRLGLNDEIRLINALFEETCRYNMLELESIISLGASNSNPLTHSNSDDRDSVTSR
ncbi:hypothetical protein Scep_025941 [Stephania cephalantha]|uniref:Uncharacterized protein n=1 Tax=Stephania cephalantha TaxID=152367 RepID=A0AAP0EPF2_9MAGN